LYRYVRSRIYDAAYNSNENLLVCAPTGAGKTNIAMMAVLHEVGQHLRHGGAVRSTSCIQCTHSNP
jgi:replicative superfamily II helicase